MSIDTSPDGCNPEVNTPVSLRKFEVDPRKTAEQQTEQIRKVGGNSLVSVAYSNGVEINTSKEITTETVDSNSRSKIDYSGEKARITTSISKGDMPVIVVLEKNGVPSVYLQNYNDPTQNKNSLSGDIHDLTADDIDGGYKVRRLVILKSNGNGQESKDMNSLIANYLVDIVKGTNGVENVDTQICTYDESLLSEDKALNFSSEFNNKGKAVIKVGSTVIKPTPEVLSN